MTVVDWTQIATSIAAVLSAIGSVAAVIRTYANSRQIEAVHIATNSLTDRLVVTTRVEAHAAGVKEERERVENGHPTGKKKARGEPTRKLRRATRAK